MSLQAHDGLYGEATKRSHQHEQVLAALHRNIAGLKNTDVDSAGPFKNWRGGHFHGAYVFAFSNSYIVAVGIRTCGLIWRVRSQLITPAIKWGTATNWMHDLQMPRRKSGSPTACRDNDLKGLAANAFGSDMD